jgi:hypothetical protein
LLYNYVASYLVGAYPPLKQLFREVLKSPPLFIDYLRGIFCMRESLDEPVSVVWYYDHRAQRVKPHRLTWQNSDYLLGAIDFWHKTKTGNTLVHHFSVSDVDQKMYFKLALDTDTLHWTIEEFMAASEAAVHYATFEGA